ncbi:MAG: transposase [Candidatus Eisenbacteria sp.]|nr:transposase [Candidatus Eisenbacteria bacterium]
MQYDPKKHHRRSIRLPEWDYVQQGAYFVTICAHDKRCMFGEIVSGMMWLSKCGAIVQEQWIRTGAVRDNVELDAFVVMPNHLHGIVVLNDPRVPVGATRWVARNAIGPPVQSWATHRVAPTGPDRIRAAGPEHGSLGAIIGQFKPAATRAINRLRHTPGGLVWQRNYYEHVIRDEEEFNRIRQYIFDNPLEWDLDPENPEGHWRKRKEKWQV